MKFACMTIFKPGRRTINYKHLINTSMYYLSPNAIITTNTPTIKSHNGASLNIDSTAADLLFPNSS